jgi:hypothetical protein
MITRQVWDQRFAKLLWKKTIAHSTILVSYYLTFYYVKFHIVCGHELQAIWDLPYSNVTLKLDSLSKKSDHQ